MKRVNENGDLESVLALFADIADEVASALAENTDWGWSGVRPSQYTVDLVADSICLRALHGAGFDVLSEESGVTTPDGSKRLPDRPIVVVDPIDGSTNAGLGLPWCATALCLIVDGAPAAATVSNLRTGERFEAIRTAGAERNGTPIAVSPPVALVDAIVGVNSLPTGDVGARQFRVLGATALDICSVAAGGLDAYIDCDVGNIAVWDYLAATLILEEAGGVAGDLEGKDLVVVDHAARRSPIAASDPLLLAEILERRPR